MRRHPSTAGEPVSSPAVNTLLTRRNVATRWQVSVMTLKRRERDGTLPFLKLGKHVRYRLREIERIENEAEAI
jgi:hypothetical protein